MIINGTFRLKSINAESYLQGLTQIRISSPCARQTHKLVAKEERVLHRETVGTQSVIRISWGG